MEMKVKKSRASNIELFRVVLMVSIIASHYVHNSGLLDVIYANPSSIKTVFLLIFGWCGKPAINGFVLITGYYMCTSSINLKKHLRLLFEVEFYNITIYLLFALFYNSFSMADFVKACIPITSISTNFVSCYIVFYLFIPYINILIKALNKKQHFSLLLLLLIVYTGFGTLPKIEVSFNYLSWFFVLYLLAAYIRYYPLPIFDNLKFWRGVFIVNWFFVIGSLLFCTQIGSLFGRKMAFYFVEDSNKILAVTTAVSAFLMFKNMDIKVNKIINTMASSTLGVLLIHANCDMMREWLWGDVLRCTEFYSSSLVYVHAILSVIIVYLLCTIIDFLRIRLIEVPFFNLVYKRRNTKC